MKCKKCRKRFALALTVCILIAVCFGVIFSHGEWWFPTVQSLRVYPAPRLTPLIETGALERWELSALSRMPNVTLSNTLLLVNSTHPLPKGYEALLEEYNGARMHPLMVAQYIALRDAVQEKTGVRIYVSSDYRTAEEQMQILAQSQDGIAAQLGCSEHEAGLALDVYAPYCAGEEFLRSPAGRLVNRICGEYGYIIRYPHGKEEITGISYEPWHLRYVGQPHAQIMMESGLTYEEYLEFLGEGQWYRTGDYLICRQRPEELALIYGWKECHISPDNTGYLIVILKMA
ncbi:MAG: M15 family metallopeptidase [Clostridia bacterium]|nr:M15 family metallopeptidase [Clostridia bacterium]